MFSKAIRCEANNNKDSIHDKVMKKGTEKFRAESEEKFPGQS